MDVIDAIRGRLSTRAYLDKAVSQSQVETILEAARWAPSGVNTQPWHVSVVAGEQKKKICGEIIQAYTDGIAAHPEYQYYPEEWFEPYKSRRFACGMALYGALNIAREDKTKRRENWMQNYRFFDAPVGLFIWIDKKLGIGSWMDLGMFIQNIMLAARGVGLETCPQAAMAEYPDIVHEQLKVPDSLSLVCGMALGFADYEHPVNNYRTDRDSVDNFTSWYGFIE